MVALFQQLIQTGVDYVTATTTTTDGRERYDFWAHQWLNEELAAGNECREWSGHGYSGLAAGSVQYGRYGDSTLVRVSGRDADVKARQLIRLATNVSRIDFESTVRLNRDEKGLASHFERRARAHKGKHVKAFEVELRRNDVRGETLYLGRRQSERLLRVYNKHAESKHPFYERCWRAEVQYGGKLAYLRALHWSESPADSMFCHKTVELEMRRRGLPWLRLPERSHLVLKVVPVKMPTTDERSLEWLRSQVRPTVVKLLDHGKLVDVLKALGLNG